MDAKPWYKSKTLYFFALTLVVAVAGAFGFAGYQPDAQQQEIISIVVSVVGIILRMITSKAISAS